MASSTIDNATKSSSKGVGLITIRKGLEAASEILVEVVALDVTLPVCCAETKEERVKAAAMNKIIDQ